MESERRKKTPLSCWAINIMTNMMFYIVCIKNVKSQYNSILYTQNIYQLSMRSKQIFDLIKDKKNSRKMNFHISFAKC